jgi:hypothetical protein
LILSRQPARFPDLVTSAFKQTFRGPAKAGHYDWVRLKARTLRLGQAKNPDTTTEAGKAGHDNCVRLKPDCDRVWPTGHYDL